MYEIRETITQDTLATVETYDDALLAGDVEIHRWQEQLTRNGEGAASATMRLQIVDLATTGGPDVILSAIIRGTGQLGFTAANHIEAALRTASR